MGLFRCKAGKIENKPQRNNNQDQQRGIIFSEALSDQDRDRLASLSERLDTFISQFETVFPKPGLAQRQHAFDYLHGLLIREGKRNIERVYETVPETTYFPLYRFVSRQDWDDQSLCKDIGRRANQILGPFQQQGLIIDPSAFLKKGSHSVGVGRGWAGCAGKLDNRQLGVFASLSAEGKSILIDKRLYLPREWTDDSERLDVAQVPSQERVYKSTAELALELVEQADRNGLRYGWVGMDGEFGKSPWLMAELDRMGKTFLIDIHKSKHVYLRHPRLRTRDKRGRHKRMSMLPKSREVVEIVAETDQRKWGKLRLRETSTGVLEAELLHLKVWVMEEGKPRRRHLIVRREQNKNGELEYKYSLSNAPMKAKKARLAYWQCMRYWVEHAIKECKDGLGLDEYQVRRWRAWHHHMALTMLAALFLLEERQALGRSLPLLTLNDVIALMKPLLPDRRMIWEEAMRQMFRRHRLRAKAMNHRRSKLTAGAG